MNIDAIHDAIEPLLRGTRTLVRDAFASPPRRPGRKDDGTVVTALDHALEERIGGGLLALDARWGVVGEEGGVLREGHPTWYLDALDGTLNFSRRIPLFVSQAALVDERGPVAAFMYDALHDRFAWAARGAGATLEDRPLYVSRRPIEDAVLLVDISRSGAFVTNPEVIPRLRRSVFRMRSLGCAGLHFLEVARGAADAFLGTRRRPSPMHDVAPGVLFVREAGALATNLAGEDALSDRRSILAAHHELHAALRAIVAKPV